MGANVLVEFENICLNWGHFFTIGGIFFKLGAKNYLGILRIIWTPAGWQYFYLEKIYLSGSTSNPFFGTEYKILICTFIPTKIPFLSKNSFSIFSHKISFTCVFYNWISILILC